MVRGERTNEKILPATGSWQQREIDNSKGNAGSLTVQQVNTDEIMSRTVSRSTTDTKELAPPLHGRRSDLDFSSEKAGDAICYVGG